MLYDNTPLSQEGVKTTKWEGAWNPESMQQGQGILLEGTFQKKVKHIIQDHKGVKVRYVVFHIEFKQACRRRFDDKGKELEANFGQTGLVRTGYLQSSYKMETKSASDALSFQDVCQCLPPSLVKLFPAAHSHALCFLGDEDTYDHLDLQYGQPVRLKTKGNSLFIESLTKLDMDQKVHSTNYTGAESAGKSWTDRVMSVKQAKDDPPRPQEEVERGDDEWDN